jgi:hypothetical protein
MALSNLVCPKSGTKMAKVKGIIDTVFDIKPQKFYRLQNHLCW